MSQSTELPVASPRLRLALGAVLIFAILGSLVLLAIPAALAQEALTGPAAIDPAALSYAFMAAALATAASDRKIVVEGKSVDLGGRRIIKTKKR